VIPIEDSVLYVEPIYIRAAGISSIPEVREIVVGYQDGDEFVYGIGVNLETALDDLFRGMKALIVDDGEGDAIGGVAGGAATQDGQVMTDDERAAALAELNERYAEMKRALDEMGDLIERLQ
ncbi:MAG: UPF0182 family protein, partial [Oscillospiraceae bacterium]|nr:UPF0182 family protein [Oscillospiraceae bacterium]